MELFEASWKSSVRRSFTRESTPQIMDQPYFGPFDNYNYFCQMQSPDLVLQFCTASALLHVAIFNLLLQQFIGNLLELAVTRVVCAAPDLGMQMARPVLFCRHCEVGQWRTPHPAQSAP